MLNDESKTMSNDMPIKTTPPIHHSAFGVQHSAVKRLLVRGPNWIGDAVMSEPALAALRRLFPAVEISLLVKSPIAELLRGHPAIDRILVYEDRGRHAGLTGKWLLAGTLRRQQFDLAVLFQNAFEAALLAFLAGIPHRCGYATDGRSLLLSEAIAVPERAKTGHQVQYYLDLLRPLGVREPPGPPKLYLAEGEEQEMGRKLAEVGVGETDLLIGLNPGSTYGSAKRWLPERFAETADRLVHECDARTVRVVIVGARGEEALARSIAERMQAKPVLLSGQTSIRELMAVIKRCGLFLTNDTGPMHIAAAFGVPVVAVFGPTDARATAPFGGRHAVVHQAVECSPCLLRECPIDHRCMARVLVDEVYLAARRQLEMHNAKCEMINLEPQAPSSSLETPHPSPLTPHGSLQGVTVFLDRDGTLNRDTGYVKTPEELELFPGVTEAIARLNRAGLRVVVITNQSGVGRGLFSSADLERIHARLRALLLAGGASLEAIYFCPHHPDDQCACRKPQTAMVERAATELGLDPSRAYVVGDQQRDVELARAVGARSVLVTTGPTSRQALEALESQGLPPDRVAAGLGEAVDWIIQDAFSRQRSTFSRQVQAESSPLNPNLSSSLKADR